MKESHEDFLCSKPIISGTSNEIFNILNTCITTKKNLMDTVYM